MYTNYILLTAIATAIKTGLDCCRLYMKISWQPRCRLGNSPKAAAICSYASGDVIFCCLNGMKVMVPHSSMKATYECSQIQI